MQKKTKKVLATVLTVIFVLSAGYFALVAPTTAWYYQEENDTYSFKFGDFEVEQENRQEITTAIPLRAATRFADAGEILFDEVVHVVKVDAENTGGMAAQIKVNVTEEEGNPEGLKWYIYDTSVEEEIPDVTGSSVAEKGKYKEAVENMLFEYSITPVDYASLESDNVEAEYENYNQNAVEALDSHNGNKIVFASGEQKVVYVVFWAEYGEVKGSFVDDSTVDVNEYNVNIDFEASPYIPEYQDVVITNESSVATGIMIYTNGSALQYSGKYYRVEDGNEEELNTTTGLIEIPNDGKEYRIRLEVGTPFKLRMASNTTLCKFDVDENEGTVSDSFVTGAVTNFGNNVRIIDL